MHSIDEIKQFIGLVKSQQSVKIFVYFVLLIIIVTALAVGYFSFGYINSEKFQNDSSITQNLEVTPGTAPESAEEYLIVDLGGAVKKPGTYKLVKNSRMGEAIKMGEGFLTNTSFTWVAKNLNLAEKLSDEQKIYIPFEWDLLPEIKDCPGIILETIATNSDENSDINDNNVTNDSNKLGEDLDKINVNTADLKELESLTGIGEVYANSIIKNRPYQNIDELKNKNDFSDSLISKIEGFISY